MKKTLLTILFFLFALMGCRAGLSPEDKAFMDKNCRGDNCYMNFEKTNNSNPCTGIIVPIECHKDNPNAGSSGGRPEGSGNGNGNSNGPGKSPPCEGLDCPGGILGVGGEGETDGGGGSGGTQGPGGSFGDFLKGTGDVLTAIGDAISDGWEGIKGELNGSNAEKRRKAREGKRLLAEAKDLWDQAEKFGEGIAADGAAIDENWRQLQSTYEDAGIKTRQQDLTNFRGRYNGRTREILDGVPVADPSVFDGMGRGLGDGIYPEHKKVEQGRRYLNYARGKVEGFQGQADYEARKTLVDIGDSFMDAAEGSYREGNVQEGNALHDLGIAAADAALSLTPIIGWAKDAYEAATGNSLLTGKKLSTFERSMAVVGVLTVGVGSKIGLLAKGTKVFSALADAAKGAGQADEVLKAGEKAVKIATAARKAGIKDKGIIDEVASGLKEGLPCQIVQIRVVPTLLKSFIESTAYATGCLPGTLEEKIVNTFGSMENASAIAKAMNSKNVNWPTDSHALERLLDRNISKDQADMVLDTGRRYFDIKNESIVTFADRTAITGSAGSTKLIGVAVDPGTMNVKTVLRESRTFEKLPASRFLELR